MSMHMFCIPTMAASAAMQGRYLYRPVEENGDGATRRLYLLDPSFFGGRSRQHISHGHGALLYGIALTSTSILFHHAKQSAEVKLGTAVAAPSRGSIHQNDVVQRRRPQTLLEFLECRSQSQTVGLCVRCEVARGRCFLTA
jgi:hypothetical protein